MALETCSGVCSNAPCRSPREVALGKRVFKNDMRVVDDVASGQSLKEAAKRRIEVTEKDLIKLLLTGGNGRGGAPLAERRQLPQE